MPHKWDVKNESLEARQCVLIVKGTFSNFREYYKIQGNCCHSDVRDCKEWSCYTLLPKSKYLTWNLPLPQNVHKHYSSCQADLPQVIYIFPPIRMEHWECPNFLWIWGLLFSCFSLLGQPALRRILSSLPGKLKILGW